MAVVKRTLKLFVIPPGRAPAGPPDPAREMEIDAPTIDALGDEARRQLTEAGYRIRAVSFTPDGMVAYAEEKA